MKRLSLALLLVLALTGLPVAGGPPAASASASHLSPAADPLGFNLVPASVPLRYSLAAGDPQIALIDQASRLLQEKFFEPVDTSVLYAAALKAANDELKNQKSPAQLAATTFGADAAKNWGLFYDAFMAAARQADDVDQKALAYATIRGMADGLNDCHTYFMTPEELAQLQKQMAGNDKRSGLGVVLGTTSDGYPFFSDVIPGSPAAKADLRPGDKLLKVGSDDVKGLTATQVAAKVRGPVGEDVTLTLSRLNAGEMTKTITRAEYTVPVYDIKTLDGGVGYIRIYSFAFTLKKESFQEFYRKLKDSGATSIVIDLRDNPGGSAQAAVDLLSTMIPANKPLFSLISRDGTEAAYSSTDNLWPDKPQVAILINKNSASASEIVAAVAQDYGVAKIYGMKTEGCVATVTFSKLADGSALGITSSRIDTAKGRKLNRLGVPPDVEVDRNNDELAAGYDAQLATATAFLRGQPGPTKPEPAATNNPAPPSARPAATTSGGPPVALAAGASPSKTEVLSLVPAGTPVERGSFVLTLEDPAPNAQVVGQTTIGGWAVNRAGTVDEVSITLDMADGSSTPIGTAQYGLARPDVAAALGATYLNSGYRLSVDAGKLAAGDQRLTIRVRSGQDVETYTIPVRVGAGSVHPWTALPLAA